MRLYRVARPAPPRRHLVMTFAWMLLVWFLALVALPVVLRSVERLLDVDRWTVPAGAPVGTGILLAASGFGLWCAVSMARGQGTPVPFDAAAHLVATGPYRWIRNPMALSGVAQTVGVALLVGSPLYLLVPPAGALLWQLVIRPSEERFLQDRFGAEYRAYRSSVPLWVPHRLRPGRRSG